MPIPSIAPSSRRNRSFPHYSELDFDQLLGNNVPMNLTVEHLATDVPRDSVLDFLPSDAEFIATIRSNMNIAACRNRFEGCLCRLTRRSSHVQRTLFKHGKDLFVVCTARSWPWEHYKPSLCTIHLVRTPCNLSLVLTAMRIDDLSGCIRNGPVHRGEWSQTDK